MVCLKEDIRQKRRFPKKDMRWSREILIKVILINIKEAHPKEKKLKV